MDALMRFATKIKLKPVQCRRTIGACSKGNSIASKFIGAAESVVRSHPGISVLVHGHDRVINMHVEQYALSLVPLDVGDTKLIIVKLTEKG
jgi:hypothetical protein